MDKHDVKGFLYEKLIELDLVSDSDALKEIVYFSDLGADSIAMLNIVVLMEEEFKVVFPDEQLTFEAINHIGKFCDFFASGTGLIHG
ncbi:acyl carrier protein [Paenibacillus piscarius]|uniref:acyl carrier protein n=1 Tax=Paenibacillus piscarius TaxID=1089681 RepID=UPI001EE8DD87|nr:acyl carrier protein [Paenibacillus piscarius]